MSDNITEQELVEIAERVRGAVRDVNATLGQSLNNLNVLLASSARLKIHVDITVHEITTPYGSRPFIEARLELRFPLYPNGEPSS